MLLWFFLTVYLSYVPLFLFLTVQIKGLMQFRLYDPEGIYAFRITESGTPQQHFSRRRFTKGLAG